MPLCIAVSLDKTTLNSSRSRTATPVTVMIYNLSGDSEKKSFGCEFAGYVPDLPESKHRLDAVLSEQGGKYKYARKAAIAQAEYEALLSYLAQLLKPLKKCQSEGGFRVQVGNSYGKFEINAIPYVVAIIGDNEGSSHIAGVSTSKTHNRCRICTKQDCSSFNLSIDPTDFQSTATFRSDADSMTIAKERADLDFKLFKSQKLNATEKSRLKELVGYNIAPASSNPFMKL